MIEVKNVTKNYGKFTAVNNISFTVNDGEIVGFLGPNGAGKSTTMNMITGYIEPTEGTITVNGYDIVKKPKKAKKQIGYMPENVPSYQELTTREFLKYMSELKRVNKKEIKDEIERVMNQTGLSEVKNKLIRNLSRGYKQRVSLAAALIGNPEVIILDEPTVGLDPKQILEIRNLIKDLGKKHTVILSSHILSEVSQICEKVIIINSGKIVAIDTPEKLEDKTINKNVIYVTVEDKKDKMSSIDKKIKGIEELTLVKDNEDGTKQYKLVSKEEVDLRKQLFSVLPKEDITIFELKKAEVTLEDAFMKLVQTSDKKIAKEEKKTEKKVEKKEEKIEEEKPVKKTVKNETKPKSKAKETEKKETKKVTTKTTKTAKTTTRKATTTKKSTTKKGGNK